MKRPIRHWGNAPDGLLVQGSSDYNPRHLPVIQYDVVLWDHEDESTHANGCGHGTDLFYSEFRSFEGPPVRLDLLEYTGNFNSGYPVASWKL